MLRLDGVSVTYPGGVTALHPTTIELRGGDLTGDVRRVRSRARGRAACLAPERGSAGGGGGSHRRLLSVCGAARRRAPRRGRAQYAEPHRRDDAPGLLGSAQVDGAPAGSGRHEHRRDGPGGEPLPTAVPAGCTQHGASSRRLSAGPGRPERPALHPGADHGHHARRRRSLPMASCLRCCRRWPTCPSIAGSTTSAPPR